MKRIVALSINKSIIFNQFYISLRILDKDAYYQLIILNVCQYETQGREMSSL